MIKSKRYTSLFSISSKSGRDNNRRSLSNTGLGYGSYYSSVNTLDICNKERRFAKSYSGYRDFAKSHIR